jgi:hypothetical protein
VTAGVRASESVPEAKRGVEDMARVKSLVVELDSGRIEDARTRMLISVRGWLLSL